MEKIEIEVGSEDYYRRMSAANARSQWELGDKYWAGMLVWAFLHPDDDARYLEEEMNA